MSASIWTPGTPTVVVENSLIPSVTDTAYGAVGDGVTVNTAAFTAAQAANEFTYVPEGTFLVGAGLNYWQFYGIGTVLEIGNAPTTQAREWDLSPTEQTTFGTLKKYKNYTWGTYENACASSICVATPVTPAQGRTNTQILGTSGGGLKTNRERPSVALNLSVYDRAVDTLTATTFTATTVVDAGVPALISAGKLKRGMIIDINLSTDRQSSDFTGTIQSWDSATNTITVDAWWSTGAVSGTPSAAAVATVNPVNKLWGQNTNVAVLTSDDVNASGYELGLIANSAAKASGIWGFDAVNLGSGGGVATQYANQAHFISRGLVTHAFIASANWSVGGSTGATVGFAAELTQLDGFVVRNPASSTYAFSVVTGATVTASTGLFTTGGTRKWSVNSSGEVVNDFKAIALDTDVTVVSAGHVISANANTIVNTTLNRAFILPTAVGNGGRVYTLIGALQCTLQAAAGQTLDGALPAYPTFIPNGLTLRVISDNSQWYLLNNPAREYSDYVTTTATTYTVRRQDSFINYAGSGAKSVVLPTPIGALGKRYIIRATVDFTASTAAGQIENATGTLGATLAVVQYTTLEVISDNSNWMLVRTPA